MRKNNRHVSPMKSSQTKNNSFITIPTCGMNIGKATSSSSSPSSSSSFLASSSSSSLTNPPPFSIDCLLGGINCNAMERDDLELHHKLPRKRACKYNTSENTNMKICHGSIQGLSLNQDNNNLSNKVVSLLPTCVKDVTLTLSPIKHSKSTISIQEENTSSDKNNCMHEHVEASKSHKSQMTTDDRYSKISIPPPFIYHSNMNSSSVEKQSHSPSLRSSFLSYNHLIKESQQSISNVTPLTSLLPPNTADDPNGKLEERLLPVEEKYIKELGVLGLKQIPLSFPSVDHLNHLWSSKHGFCSFSSYASLGRCKSVQ